MVRGFFSSSELLKVKTPVSRIPKCGACGLFETCASPKMEVSGEGRRKILVIGEAPGKEEDAQGIPFVGPSGKLLEEHLRSAGINLRRDCWTTNAIICRPPNNATPDDKKIGYCRPNLISTIERLKPEVIVPLGQVAVSSLMSWLWKEKSGSVTRWVGWQIPNQRLNCWVCPSFHPSFVLRARDDVAKHFFSKHLHGLSDLSGRPWPNGTPDYRSMVERIREPRKAAKIIRGFLESGGPIAFDYECNCLKPETEGAEIVSGSICWKGERTIAYIWHGEAIEATKEILRSADIPKIGANMKFEDRWTRVHLGFGIRGFLWDTVVGAHVLDLRKEITSVKFQAFVRLGADLYNSHIEPLLEARKGSKLNRIKEIDLEDLLLYNGMDSLLEYQLAVLQMEELEHPDVAIVR